MASMTAKWCIFLCLSCGIISLVAFIVYKEFHHGQVLLRMHKDLDQMIRGRKLVGKEKFINDLITQTEVDLQYEVEENVLKTYKDTLKKQIRERYLKEMVYVLFRDLKWKIVKELKTGLKDDVRLFVKDHPKYTLVKKPYKEMKVVNGKKELTFPSEPKIIKADVNNICQGKTMKHHNRVLSFCVYGKRQIYYDGIEVVMKNARNISLYKNWQIRIYHDEAVSPEKIKEFLKKDDNIVFCDARKLPRYGNLQNILGKFWRVAPISDPSVDVMCSRDLDSKILTREEDAVNEWLTSGMVLHTMRDHRQHEVGMMAGMWCWNNQVNRTIGKFYFERLIEKAKTYKRTTDQPLLNAVIWDHLSKHNLYDMILQHDSYNCKFYKGSKPFPTKRKRDNEFIGCPVHECDQELKPCPEMCRPSYGKFWKYC